MYYDEEGRRFNLLSGLLFGGLLGAGLALALRPRGGRRRGRAAWALLEAIGRGAAT